MKVEGFDSVEFVHKSRQPGEPSLKDFIEQGKGADEVIEDPTTEIGLLSPQKALLLARLKGDFSYHKADADGVRRMNKLRDSCYLLAQLMVETVPVGRELSTALTHLEQVMFNANAGISRVHPPADTAHLEGV